MKSPIFIGGCGSSGTTLLRRMINAHPNIGCGPEMSVFDRPRIYEISMAHLYTLFRSDDFDELDDGCIYPIRYQPMDKSYCGLSDAGHRRFYFEKKKEVEKMFDQAEDTVAFLRLFFDKWAEDQGAGRWAEKTPNNIFTAGIILDAYPDGKFINVIRDGRDVVISLTERRKTNIYTAVFRWLAATEAGLRVSGNSGGRFMTVKYEDLVLRTDHSLKMVCSFIGEDFDRSMLDYWQMELPEDVNSFNNPTMEYGKQPVFTDSICKWKKEGINRTLMDQIDLTLMERIKRLGYEQ